MMMHSDSFLEETKSGTVNSIWFVRPGSDIDLDLIANFFKLAEPVLAENFILQLWTNIEHVSAEKIDQLRQKEIMVRDYSELRESRFYPYFLYFLRKLEIENDVIASALASDIFRMMIIEQSPDDKPAIYFDGNDIIPVNIRSSLRNLNSAFSTNQLGFAFNISCQNIFGAKILNRNIDVLIALKERNLPFFHAFFEFYETHLRLHHQNYKKPATFYGATGFASSITQFNTPAFFEREDDKWFSNGLTDMIYPTFLVNGQRILVNIDTLNCSSYFPFAIEERKSLTWLRDLIPNPQRPSLSRGASSPSDKKGTSRPV